MGFVLIYLLNLFISMQLARWLLAWARHNRPESDEGAALAGLVRWEAVEGAAELLARPEAHLLGPGVLEDAALRRLRHAPAPSGGFSTPPAVRGAAPPSRTAELPNALLIPLRVTGLGNLSTISTDPSSTPSPLVVCPDGDTLIRVEVRRLADHLASPPGLITCPAHLSWPPDLIT